MLKLDKRRKYYLILDCETATLPCASEITETPRQKQKIAIAKPLIYDLGWQVVDRQGKVYARKNYLITEIFSVPSVFNTAYYKNKRPIYLEKLKNKEITLVDWNTAIADLIDDMTACESVGAYNSMFDFKKAIPFTETYIKQLYSENYQEWYEYQVNKCKEIAKKPPRESTNEFEPDCFRFRGSIYPLFDLWRLSCQHLLNTDEYKQLCIENDWQTASGKYFKTSAETAFRYLTQELEFAEAHTALDDVMIESQIFSKIANKTKNKWGIGIIYFPFKELGTVEEWLIKNNK